MNNIDERRPFSRNSMARISFDERFRDGEEESHVGVLGKNISDRRNSLCKSVLCGIFLREVEYGNIN